MLNPVTAETGRQAKETDEAIDRGLAETNRRLEALERRGAVT